MSDTTDLTINNDYKLCLANAINTSKWLKEQVTVYSIGEGKKKQFFFRLKGDPREVDGQWSELATSQGPPWTVTHR